MPPIDTAQVAASRRLSVAPMMDWTDRHCRFFHRQISQNALLYTEMVTAPALVRGGALHLLDYDVAEHPVVLQLGGSDPAELRQAARIGAEHGYDQINLNVGCPSDRVQSGCFGAVLMTKPELVAECVAEMQADCAVPVTVKCRIGVDEQEPHDVLPAFIETVRTAGVTEFIIHARKAWLQGLSPKENRDIPPLDYPLVLQMKQQFPDLMISINGGIDTIAAAKPFLDQGLDGVMIGRAAYHQPYDVLALAEAEIFGQTAPDRAEVIDRMLPYIALHLEDGGKLHQITRHMLGLFAGVPGARQWRRYLSENAPATNAGVHTVKEAAKRVFASA